jgi:large subunit ribosomal protein L30e
MAKAKTAGKQLNKDIRDAASAGKTALGTKVTLKLIKTGKATSVVIANDCPKEMREQVSKATAKKKVVVEDFTGTSEELGEICKKMFSVAVLALKK